MLAASLTNELLAKGMLLGLALALVYGIRAMIAKARKGD